MDITVELPVVTYVFDGMISAAESLGVREANLPISMFVIDEQGIDPLVDIDIQLPLASVELDGLQSKLSMDQTVKLPASYIVF